MEAKILKWFMRLFVVIPIIFISIHIVYMLAVAQWSVGRGFPSEHELSYETGYLKSRKDVYFCKKNDCRYYPTIILTKSLDTATGQEYYCHYNHGRKDPCFGNKFPDEYRNQLVKIGYYIQPDFLWHKDNTRQLVTLEANGKMVVDYQKSKETLERKKSFDYQAFGFILILAVIGLSPILLMWGVFALAGLVRLIKNGAVNNNRKQSS
ncbi:Uncharacterised protein [Moraxella caprae]|uniref:Uncharacterized protein n=1 Tax=Moraxella caprae TaxID=90240 RepID=A0A378QWJ2_9GAMM|nr:hypothetical protein [Moraxella caprae]STZ07372.1 Uncharacterised protein [Moraxella caprae]